MELNKKNKKEQEKLFDLLLRIIQIKETRTDKNLLLVGKCSLQQYNVIE